MKMMLYSLTGAKIITDNEGGEYIVSLSSGL
jgi:hypothetical protein